MLSSLPRQETEMVSLKKNSVRRELKHNVELTVLFSFDNTIKIGL